ncbi:DUF420 domain-containing protein [candidate division BRC1 bacterium HGW-BRC1-1]|jgi:uncharacterized membrane protein YozB (DUF420 family)|nr:MAG: DUF420 domain-containing protein [candidate division BRC1 bacterium HGW-BRC1-1]
MESFIASLPHANAGFNTLTALLLLAGWWFVRHGQISRHRNCMVAALVSSCFFLAGYLTYHFNHGATVFPPVPVVRGIYLTILLTHTVLAAVTLPLVIAVVWQIAHGRIAKHRRLARITMPIWLYVSVTGVVIYVMLYHLYPVR